MIGNYFFHWNNSVQRISIIFIYQIIMAVLRSLHAFCNSILVQLISCVSSHDSWFMVNGGCGLTNFYSDSCYYGIHRFPEDITVMVVIPCCHNFCSKNRYWGFYYTLLFPLPFPKWILCSGFIQLNRYCNKH